MTNTNHDAYSEKRTQELDQLEQDAKDAGSTVKKSRLDEGRDMSEDALISFASVLAQLYLQKHIQHLNTEDITLYMLLYVRFFRAGYKEMQPQSGVSYTGRIY
jgi:hypothetical protein